MHTLTQESAHGARGAGSRQQNNDKTHRRRQKLELGEGSGGGDAKEEGVRRAKAAARARGEVRASLSPVRHMQNPRVRDRDMVLDWPRGRREAEPWKRPGKGREQDELSGTPPAHRGLLLSLPPSAGLVLAGT